MNETINCTNKEHLVYVVQTEHCWWSTSVFPAKMHCLEHDLSICLHCARQHGYLKCRLQSIAEHIKERKKRQDDEQTKKRKINEEEEEEATLKQKEEKKEEKEEEQQQSVIPPKKRFKLCEILSSSCDENESCDGMDNPSPLESNIRDKDFKIFSSIVVPRTPSPDVFE